MFLRAILRLSSLFCPGLFLMGCVTVTASPTPVTQPESPSVRLAAVAEAQWQHSLATTLPLRLKLGLPVHDLPDVSWSGAQREAEFARSILGRLATIPPAALTPDERRTLGAIRWQAEMVVQGLEHYWLSFPVTPYASPIATTHYAFVSFPFNTSQDLAVYLDLLARYPVFLRQIHAKLAEQRRRGILIPKAEVPAVRALVGSCMAPAGNAIFTVDPDRLGTLKGVGKEARAAFHRRVEKAIQRIRPELEGLLAFLGEEYEGEAPEALGLWQYPGGDAYYDYLVRFHTTLDVTPEAVHQIGLREVARLEGEMAALHPKLGFVGTPAALHQRLRTDPAFHPRPREPEALRQRMLDLARGIQPELGRLFLHQPAAPFDVRRLDGALEGSMAFGFYQDPTPGNPVGTYFFNGSNLEERPLVVLEALVYHELEPGHHFQINLASENEALIPLRRELQATAYTEGWGEYASSLGVELGKYQDPFDYYGRLLMDMLVSVRLVVDTGIHRLRWTEQQAFDYMRQRLLDSDEQIRTEILRYATDIPGQALAYKMGGRHFAELRREAEAALGDAFDVRQFHDAVLGGGALPMGVLEDHIRWWIGTHRLQEAR